MFKKICPFTAMCQTGDSNIKCEIELDFEGEQNLSPQNVIVGVQDKPSQKCCFGIMMILNCWHLKNNNFGERLSQNSPYLSKDRTSTWN